MTPTPRASPQTVHIFNHLITTGPRPGLHGAKTKAKANPRFLLFQTLTRATATNLDPSLTFIQHRNSLLRLQKPNIHHILSTSKVADLTITPTTSLGLCFKLAHNIAPQQQSAWFPLIVKPTRVILNLPLKLLLTLILG